MIDMFYKGIFPELEPAISVAAVSALPRYELAKLAEALVNLTAFRARMSATEDERVGGPVDVAVISKGDGFVWVKKKDLVRGETPRGDSLL